MQLLKAGAAVVLLGIATGVGAAWMRLVTVPRSEMLPAEPASSPGDEVATPSCVVDATSYYFGTMGVHHTASHVFVFRNTGRAPLHLTAGETSCHCTLSKIAQGVVKPGESTEVTVEWQTKDWAEEYRQTATILTNDLENPRITLSVTGLVTVVVRAAPSEVDLGAIPTSEAGTGQFRVYGYLDAPLEIRGWTIANPAVESFFDVQWRPLSPPEIEDSLASSGVMATITVKPGLPQGAFLQTITLNTNQETASRIEVPIHGKITSDIGIVGKGWDSEKGLLIIGAVKASAGAERRLMLIARGPHRKDVRFSLEQTVPGNLEAVIGQPTPIGDGAAMQTPLLVRIPKGTHSVNCLGSSQGDYGRIRLKTNHPVLPEILLLVSYYVEGD